MDVFTGKIYEAVIRSSLSVDALDVISKEYQLIDIEWDGSTVLLLEDGSLRKDFKISVTDDAMGGVSVILLTSFLRFIFSGIDGEKLKELFGSGKDVLVLITTAMGIEQIVSFRPDPNC